MTDRLAEMKQMVLDVARRVKGDDFMIGLIQNVETNSWYKPNLGLSRTKKPQKGLRSKATDYFRY